MRATLHLGRHYMALLIALGAAISRVDCRGLRLRITGLKPQGMKVLMAMIKANVVQVKNHHFAQRRPYT